MRQLSSLFTWLNKRETQKANGQQNTNGTVFEQRLEIYTDKYLLLRLIKISQEINQLRQDTRMMITIINPLISTVAIWAQL